MARANEALAEFSYDSFYGESVDYIAHNDPCLKFLLVAQTISITPLDDFLKRSKGKSREGEILLSGDSGFMSIWPVEW